MPAGQSLILGDPDAGVTIEQENVERPEPGIGMRLEEEPSPARIEAFSDGVFSIVITLLVLDLRVPRDATLQGRTLAAALLQQWPTYLAYVMSFLQVGVVWANHHMMFHHIRRSDHVLLVCNLLLLLCTAVLPFTTSLLAEYAYHGKADFMLAALLYSGALCCAGLFFNAIWTHALRAGLVNPHADPNRIYALRQHWRLVPVFYGIAFLLAFVDPRWSVGMYALLLFYYALPGPALVRWVTAKRFIRFTMAANKHSAARSGAPGESSEG
jgi:uncharacterized membrane protein